jgi:hypothetical protein
MTTARDAVGNHLENRTNLLRHATGVEANSAEQEGRRLHQANKTY